MPFALFGSFILVLCVFWSWSFSLFHAHFNGPDQYLPIIEQLKRDKEVARMETRLVQEELVEYRQQVATLVPDFIKDHLKGEEGYAVRQLASSAVTSESSDLKNQISETFMLRGKTLFNAGMYQESSKIFSQFIDRYSFSPRIGEAYFLLVEGYFRVREFENASKAIRKMVSLFPENELTGFALIRLAQIFEMESRPEEAAELYQMVLRSFPQREIATQAKESLQSLEF